MCGRNDAKAETPVFWPPDAKNRLIGKDPDVGRGFPDTSVDKESACNAGDPGSIPGSGRSPGKKKKKKKNKERKQTNQQKQCHKNYKENVGTKLRAMSITENFEGLNQCSLLTD